MNCPGPVSWKAVFTPVFPLEELGGWGNWRYNKTGRGSVELCTSYWLFLRLLTFHAQQWHLLAGGNTAAGTTAWRTGPACLPTRWAVPSLHKGTMWKVPSSERSRSSLNACSHRIPASVFKTKRKGRVGTSFFTTNARPGLDAQSLTWDVHLIQGASLSSASAVEISLPRQFPGQGRKLPERATVHKMACSGHFQPRRERSGLSGKDPVLLAALPLRLSTRARPCTELPGPPASARAHPEGSLPSHHPPRPVPSAQRRPRATRGLHGLCGGLGVRIPPSRAEPGTVATANVFPL